LHEKAWLDASKCWVMNGKRFVSCRQWSVECDEMDGEIHKNTDQKTNNGNNLAKLNDAECSIC